MVGQDMQEPLTQERPKYNTRAIAVCCATHSTWVQLIASTRRRSWSRGSSPRYP